MNRLYLTAMAVAVASFGVSAQGVGTQRYLKQRALDVPNRTTPTVTAQGGERAVIWSDDFSNPANWTIGNINDPNNDNWVIGTDGPSGSFAIAPIASTTADNGFALFDSDLLCGGSQNAWVAMANPVNLSANSGVVVQFEQYFRRFRGDTYVEVSTNGTDWTEIEVNAEIAVNNATLNPDLEMVDISAIAGGQAQVWIRFRYFSTVADHGSGAGCDYAWMVDDVSIITLPDYEMITTWGYTSQFGNGMEYARIPQNQMPSTINAGAQVVNFGSQPQTNVTVTTTITDASSATVGTATSTFATMNNGDTVLSDETITLPSPLPVGLYTATFTISSDQIGSDENPADNTAYRYFEVTDDWYSLDGINLVPDSVLRLTTLGTGSFTDNNQDVRFLNYYNVIDQSTFTGVEVVLDANNSMAGSYFIAAVYDTSEMYVGTPLSSPLVESEPRVITEADLAAGVAQVAFMDPLTLDPNAYYVAVRLFQEGGNDLYILDDITVEQPFDATMLWIPNDDQGQFIYSNGNAMGIRLTTDPSVGVQENPSLTGVSMYPNPTNGQVEIRVQDAGKMTVEVFNALGALVKTAHFNGTTSSINLEGNAPGIYSVRISDGARFNVQRIAVK